MPKTIYLPCPECESKKVDLVKPVITKMVKRRYFQCHHCGNRFWTTEFSDNASFGDFINMRTGAVAEENRKLTLEIESMAEMIEWWRNDKKKSIIGDTRRKLRYEEQ